MADLKDVVDELKNPWDWLAAIVGAGGGAAVTVLAHGTDLGHAIPAGALGAVGARRAAVASLARPALRKKAERVLWLLERRNDSHDLAELLVLEREKWELKITDNEKFSKQIDEISDLDSQRVRRRLLPPSDENP